MTNEELNKERQRYYHTRKELHFYNIYTAFMESPQAFDQTETQILDGFWESIPEQQQALWDYYNMRIKNLQNLIKNL